MLDMPAPPKILPNTAPCWQCVPRARRATTSSERRMTFWISMPAHGKRPRLRSLPPPSQPAVAAGLLAARLQGTSRPRESPATCADLDRARGLSRFLHDWFVPLHSLLNFSFARIFPDSRARQRQVAIESVCGRFTRPTNPCASTVDPTLMVAFRIFFRRQRNLRHDVWHFGRSYANACVIPPLRVAPGGFADPLPSHAPCQGSRNITRSRIALRKSAMPPFDRVDTPDRWLRGKPFSLVLPTHFPQVYLCRCCRPAYRATHSTTISSTPLPPAVRLNLDPILGRQNFERHLTMPTRLDQSARATTFPVTA